MGFQREEFALFTFFGKVAIVCRFDLFGGDYLEFPLFRLEQRFVLAFFRDKQDSYGSMKKSVCILLIYLFVLTAPLGCCC